MTERTAPRRRRAWPYWVLGLLSLVLATLACLPLAARLALIEALGQVGADSVEVADIDLNPFSGSLTVSGLRIGRRGRTRLSCQRLEIAIAMPSLLRRRIEIETLRLGGLILHSAQGRQAPLEIGGIVLPAAGTGQGQGQAPTSTWGLGWRGLVVDDARIVHEDETGRHVLAIDQAYLDTALDWQPGRDSHLAVSGAIDSAPFSIHGRLRPFASDPAIALGLTLDGLDIGPFTPTAPPAPARLAAHLGLAGKLRISRPSDRLAASYRGRIALSGPRVEIGQLRLDADGLAFEGRLWTTTDGQGPGGPRVSGRLEARSVAARLDDEPLLELTGAEIDGIEGRMDDRLDIARIRLTAPRLHIVRDSRGGTNLGRLAETPARSDGPPPAATPPADANGRPALPWRLGRIEIRQGRIDVRDQAVSPAFKAEIALERADLGPFEPEHPAEAMTWSLLAHIGDYGRIDLGGQAWPFTPTHDFTARGRIQTVSLPPFTGYGAATTGYHIDAGQLGADIDLGNRQGRLEGRIDLRLSHLALSPAEPDVIEQLTARLSMPLPTALAVLADDDGMVRIELPVSGNLDAPDFGLGPLIDKVAGIALRKAVTTYLGTMLEPYSTIFTVASTAVEMLSAIRLEPMPFPPGEAAVTPTIADYGKRLARLLAERPALSLHLCGRATPRDALALTEGRQTGEGKAPAAADPEARLRALARARAEAVRQHLVEGYGIAPGRLLVCRPVIDEDEAALPRVELSL